MLWVAVVDMSTVGTCASFSAFALQPLQWVGVCRSDVPHLELGVACFCTYPGGPSPLFVSHTRDAALKTRSMRELRV